MCVPKSHMHSYHLIESLENWEMLGAAFYEHTSDYNNNHDNNNKNVPEHFVTSNYLLCILIVCFHELLIPQPISTSVGGKARSWSSVSLAWNVPCVLICFYARLSFLTFNVSRDAQSWSIRYAEMEKTTCFIPRHGILLWKSSNAKKCLALLLMPRWVSRCTAEATSPQQIISSSGIKYSIKWYNASLASALRPV